MTSPIPPPVPETGTGAACAYAPLVKVIVAILILLAGALLASRHLKEPSPELAATPAVPEERADRFAAFFPGSDAAPPAIEESPKAPVGLAELVETVQERHGDPRAGGFSPPARASLAESPLEPAADEGEEKYAQIYPAPPTIAETEAPEPEPPEPESVAAWESPPDEAFRDVPPEPIAFSTERPSDKGIPPLEETPRVSDLQDNILPKFQFAQNFRPESREPPGDPFLEAPDIPMPLPTEPEANRAGAHTPLEALRPLESIPPPAPASKAVTPLEWLRPLETPSDPSESPYTVPRSHLRYLEEDKRANE